VSLNHRATALLASYFDVLFALNRQPHPGEKRLVRFAELLCTKRPTEFAVKIAELLASLPRMDASAIEKANNLIEGLAMLMTSGA
jgi:hypothetical protein